MRKIIYLIIPIFFGCNQESAINKTKELNSNNPYLNVKSVAKSDTKNISQKERILKLNNNHDIKLEELKAKKEENIIKLKAQNELKLKEMELNSKKAIANIELKKKKVESNKSITIAKIEQEKEIKAIQEKSSVEKIAVVIVGLILIFLAILKFLSTLSKRRHEALLKEKEFQHQAYIQDIKAKHEHISKMLEIISDEKSDKEIKKSMTKLLERGKGNILEHKKS